MASDSDRLLRRAIRAGGVWTAVLGITALLGAVTELLLPATLGRAVDAALAGESGWWPAAACVLVAVLAGTETLGDLATGAGNARATARLRRHLLRHVFALDPRTAARHPVGDLVARLVGQAADAGQAGSTVVFCLTALLPPVGSLVALTVLEPLLGATFVIGLVLLTILMRSFVTDASAAMTGYQRAQGLIAGRLHEAVTGSRTIAAAGTIRPEIDRILTPLPLLRTHGRRSWQTLARAAGRNAAVAPLLNLAVVAVGGWSVSVGWLTPGQLVAAVQYAALGTGLGAVTATLNRLVRTRAGAGRIAEVLAHPERGHGEATLPPGDGTLTFDSVTVRTPDGRTVLDRVDLRLPGGRAVAVVGASGAGKSTLAAVAGRLRDPDDGEVRLDGVPLHRLTRTELRRAVGYGFERPVLVGDTIADVIDLGVPRTTGGRSDEEGERLRRVRRSARAAAIDDFAERLPAGYHTPLPDAPMSGGEAQRLGLARALHGGRLLVLDDATSSVDTATEYRIARAVAEHGDGRTRVIVTHRATTAAAADLVAWLDGGRLRALASHRDLWAEPAYRAVFQPEHEPAGRDR